MAKVPQKCDNFVSLKLSGRGMNLPFQGASDPRETVERQLYLPCKIGFRGKKKSGVEWPNFAVHQSVPAIWRIFANLRRKRSVWYRFKPFKGLCSAWDALPCANAKPTNLSSLPSVHVQDLKLGGQA